MEFHEKLQILAAKEGLKGSKVCRAVESFSWNVTILKVCDLFFALLFLCYVHTDHVMCVEEHIE